MIEYKGVKIPELKDIFKDPKKFWDKLDEEHIHVNHTYVLSIMRSLNSFNMLNKKGKKMLEKLIIEESTLFKMEIDDETTR